MADTRPLTDVEIARIEAETRKLTLEAERLETEASYTADMQATRKAKAEEHRIYTFWGAVNGMSAGSAILTLGEWSRKAPGKDITLVFNSPGGSVIDGLALFDFIQELRHAGHHVTTVTIGMAASMGGILLQAGDKRVAGRNAYMLIHEAAAGTAGKVSEMEDSVEFAKRLQERLVGILAERSHMTPRQIKSKWSRKDWWLDADEMLSLGFVDEIR